VRSSSINDDRRFISISHGMIKTGQAFGKQAKALLKRHHNNCKFPAKYRCSTIATRGGIKGRCAKRADLVRIASAS
jgi:hypothetical protein